MTENATIIGYEPSPYCGAGWLQCIVRMHYNGEVRRSGQLPAEGTPTGPLGKPAPAPIPVGTVVQF